tara:strand:+ start:9746 stop:11098 length:1353 start_codon:yes stop_codon:yes gene_type:complete
MELILENIMERIISHLTSRRGLISFTGICLTGLIAGSTLLFQAGQNVNQMTQAKSGNDICFQRITQTFTALMVQDKGSQFLTDDFKKMTSSCLDDLKSVVAAPMAKILNNLQSDYHWFDQKLNRLSSMQGEVDIYQSNIIDKYSELESLRNQLDSMIMGSLAQARSQTTYSFAIVILSLVGFGLISFVTIYREKTRMREVQALDKQAHSAGAVIDRLFDLVETPNIKAFFASEYGDLAKEVERLEDSLLKMNTMGEETVYEIELPKGTPERSIANFQTSFNSALDGVQDKAFENGVILETDLSEEFSVFSKEEPLEQLLLSLFSFAMDNGEKVEIKSKALGGIAYCKVKIPGHSFNQSELDFMNGGEAQADTALELILLRELLTDSEAKVSIRNRTNSKKQTQTSELELIFERAHPQSNVKTHKTSEREVNIVKGSKRQIRNYLDSQMDA